MITNNTYRHPRSMTTQQRPVSSLSVHLSILFMITVLYVSNGRTQDVNSTQYVGCFKTYISENTGRVCMSYKTSLELVTIDGCIAACGQLNNNYTYAGGENGKECRCGNDNCNIKTIGCNEMCNGNPSQICGAPAIISVFLVCPPGSFQWTSQGCLEKCDQTEYCINNTRLVTTKECFPVECKSGWNGTKCDQDIDECQQPSLNKCDQNCTNTQGSYNCTCNAGYSLQNNSQSCADIDECSSPFLNRCNQTCSNTNGSYYCSCLNGSSLQNDNKTCIRIPVPMTNGVPIGTIVPAVVVLVVVCIIIAVVVFVILRKRGQTNSSKSKSHPERLVETVHDKNLTASAMENEGNQTGDVSTESAGYYNITNLSNPISHAIKVVNLPARYLAIKANTDSLRNEYKSIPEHSKAHDIDFASAPTLKAKNRFKNILPYSNNRVKLQMVNNDEHSTYINASFIQGFNADDKTIAAQGPTKNSVDDFWRMLWEYDVTTIFMLTHLVENGKYKCEQYYPDSDVMTFGDISVEIRSVEESVDHIIRTLIASKNDTHRSITHIQFTDWPDHGVPEDALPLLCFRQKTRQFIQQNKYTLYHCSAGVGRTGTYLAIDHLLSATTQTGEVDVHSCVTSLREQRMNCVQTLPQYTFIYQAVLEGVTIGESLIPAGDISQRLTQLHTNNAITGKTVLQTEFDMLSESNSVKRADGDKTLISEGNRVVQKAKIKGKHEVLNAVYVQEFKKKDGYIAIQQPSLATATQFWNICNDNNCKTVIMLSKDISIHEDFPFPLQGQTVKHGELNIHTVSREPSDKLNNCDVCVVSTGNKDIGNALYENTTNAHDEGITIILVTIPDGATPASKRLMAIHNLMKQMCQHQTMQGPTVVMSRDDMEWSGLYISVATISEKLKTENRVDVLHTVLDVKKSLPQFPSNQSDYKELYLAANLCTGKSEELVVYANVL